MYAQRLWHRECMYYQHISKMLIIKCSDVMDICEYHVNNAGAIVT